MVGDPPSTRGVAPLLRAEGLTLRYRQQPVLDDVTLSVGAGEFWFLLGPNGEGKTTFLRALLGELAPAGGRLVLDEAVRDRAAVGFVPQRCTPNPILPTTVREFVELGLVGVCVDAAQRQARVQWSLAHAGLAGLERRSYWALSGGQRQRALVARALVRRPCLLILDEPTNHLDFLIEQSILDVLAALNREEGTTILFVTHALHLAARYGTHAALFHGGRVESGPAAELLRRERLTRAYGVVPAGPEPTA
ncbi:ABC transporter ATP-binding protein [bacterium]|nr:ABC transporter ATP-binding protein [bacterium]